jgi:hypothetical protein
LIIGEFGKDMDDMKRSILRFALLTSIFSIGLFFGECLLDTILNSTRDTLEKEAIQSIFIGLFVALLMTWKTKKRIKNK